MLRCQRCGRPCWVTVRSWLTNQKLCLNCQAEEERHPLYVLARRVEAAVVRSRDFNFSGIGR